MMTRQEHLDWCKARAREYLDAGDVGQAVVSMLSDIRKHPETKDHSAIHLGVSMLFAGHLDTVDKARHFIEGFN